MNDTFQVNFFGGDQWKPFREVETHLVTKNTARTRSRSVAFVVSVF